MRTRITPNTDTFHAVILSNHSNDNFGKDWSEGMVIDYIIYVVYKQIIFLFICFCQKKVASDYLECPYFGRTWAIRNIIHNLVNQTIVFSRLDINFLEFIPLYLAFVSQIALLLSSNNLSRYYNWCWFFSRIFRIFATGVTYN